VDALTRVVWHPDPATARKQHLRPPTSSSAPERGPPRC